MQDLVVEVLGSGPTDCVMLASVGAAWSRATLPTELGDLLTIHLLVPPSEPATIAGVVDALSGFAMTLDSPALVAGLSMNGTLALAAAAEHPSMFAGVIAITSPPALPPDRTAVDRYTHALEPERKAEFDRRKAQAEAAEEGSEEELALWRKVDAVRRWHDLDFDPTPLDALAEINPAWIQGVMADGANHDWPATMRAVECPVLLILGRSDFVVPPVSWDLDDLPANFTAEVFERSGHTPPYEQPEEFVESVARWLATNP